jgi:hypothetical protein
LLYYAYVPQDAKVATGELPQARQMSEGTTKIAHTQEKFNNFTAGVIFDVFY